MSELEEQRREYRVLRQYVMHYGDATAKEAARLYMLAFLVREVQRVG